MTRLTRTFLLPYLIPLLSLLLHPPPTTAQSPTKLSWPPQLYHSFPFPAPILSYSKTSPTAPGLLFFAPIGQDADAGGFDAPTIMTDEGELVWRPETDSLNGTRNFGVQELAGRDVLTYWAGDHNWGYGLGYGAVLVLDQSYGVLYNVCMADLDIVPLQKQYFSQPCRLDSHESRITAKGTLLATARSVVQADLSSVGGPVDGWLLDSLFYEIDIPTQTVLFRWSAYEHNSQLPVLKYSTYPLVGAKKETTPWDFFHMNAVDDVAAPQEGYVISSRYLNSAIKVDAKGDIEWFLRGTDGGNFTLPATCNFTFQHDTLATPLDPTTLTLTLFDNANRDISRTQRPSSGLSLHLDLTSYTVSLNQRLSPQNFTASPHTGSYQPIPGSDNVLVDYGHPPILNEFNGDGALIYEASVSSKGGETYRAYKKPWVGNPSTSPSIVSQPVGSDNTQTQVYVSWNGATEVAAWSFAAGNSCLGLSAAKNTSGSSVFPKTGFETTVVLQGGFSHVQATALGPGGAEDVLGVSLTVETGGTAEDKGACAASAAPSSASASTSLSFTSSMASTGTTTSTSNTVVAAAAAATTSSAAAAAMHPPLLLPFGFANIALTVVMAGAACAVFGVGVGVVAVVVV